MSNQAQRSKDSPEIELLRHCARTRVDEERAERIRTLAQGKIDWGHLLQMSRRHGLTPLLYWQLNAICPELVPESDLARLRTEFNRNAARNLCLTDELCQILKLLEAHRIPAIPYKGPILASAVYGNLALRRFGDLDILVHREDVKQASELLKLRGYQKEHQLTPAQETAFIKIQCEHAFSSHKRQVYLDLHWNIVRKYFSLQIDSENFWERLEPVSLGRSETLSFSPEDLLLVLCINASKEFWNRLAQLCEITELIKTYPNLNWETVLQRASRTGTRRILSISLLLAQDLLGAIIPEEVAAEIAADAEARRLALKIRQAICEDEDKGGVRLSFLKPAKALERQRDRLKFYLRLALTPTREDWASINLPRQLFFLYYLTRPFRLARKYIFQR